MPSRTVEIAKNFYLLRSKEKTFHRNIYLKKFTSSDGSSINMIFDPGTKLDIPDLMHALKDLIGGIQNIHLIFLSHQDPDLTSNVSLLLSSAPNSYVLCSVDTWRLIQMYGVAEKRVKTVESFDSEIIKIKKTGNRIRFLPARFCHFRGSMMMYDYESRTLFTGDFLGGINTRDGDGIWADDNSWQGIASFHELYMPSNRAIRIAAERIALLNPFPEIIAPQHGDVVKGEYISNFLNNIIELKVGVDLMEKGDPDKELTALAINNFLELLEVNYPDVKESILDAYQKSNLFTSPFEVKGQRITSIKISTDVALRDFWSKIENIEEDEKKKSIKAMYTDVLEQLNVPFDYCTNKEAEEQLIGKSLLMQLNEIFDL